MQPCHHIILFIARAFLFISLNNTRTTGKELQHLLADMQQFAIKDVDEHC
jgi:hypothetical protein